MKTTKELQEEIERITGFNPYGATFEKIIGELVQRYRGSEIAYQLLNEQNGKLLMQCHLLTERNSRLEAENERLKNCQK